MQQQPKRAFEQKLWANTGHMKHLFNRECYDRVAVMRVMMTYSNLLQCPSPLPYPVDYRHKVHKISTRTNINSIHNARHDWLADMTEWLYCITLNPLRSSSQMIPEAFFQSKCCLNNWTSFSVTSVFSSVLCPASISTPSSPDVSAAPG